MAMVHITAVMFAGAAPIVMRKRALTFAIEPTCVGSRRPLAGLARARGAWTAAAAVAILALTPGCAMMPAAAPTALEVENAGKEAAGEIAVVNIDRQVVAALGAIRHEGFAGRFSSRAPAADLRIAVGDTLQVSVIEQTPGAAGLFTSPGASGGAQSGGAGGASMGTTTFMPVTVGRDGNINVPFAGSVKAAGLTLEAVRAQIERKFTDKAINPQVQLAQVGASTAGANNATVGANSATVGGDVNRASIVPLRPSGSRLLDVLAEAGGARYPAFETTVRLTRGRREASASLQRVVTSPADNVFIYPGDNIYVTHDPRTFTVLGASQKVGRYPFDSERLNLAEAVAQAGGFVDAASDPSGVFLFRFEPPSVARAIGVSLDSSFADKGAPIIYRLNLREGDGYFLARQFEMRDKDIVLVANSDSAQLLKFVNLLQAMINPVQSSASTALTIKTIQSGGAAVITTAAPIATTTATTP